MTIPRNVVRFQGALYRTCVSILCYLGIIVDATNVPSTRSLMEMLGSSSTSSTMSFCLLTLHTCHSIVSRLVRRSGVDELTDNGSSPLLALEPECEERVLKRLRDIYHT